MQISSESPTVHLERRGKVALIQLDRADRSNAIDVVTFEALGAAYYRADNDPDVEVVVLHAAGPDFSVGLDPGGFLPALTTRSFTLDGDQRLNPFGTTTRLAKPLIIAVQGIVGAMANELLLAADIRIAAVDTQFSQGEVARGTIPVGCASVRMPLEVGWGNAMRWILTGESWGAEEALRIGLVQHVVPAGQQLPRALEVAERIAGNPPLAVRAALSVGRRAWEGHAQQVYAALLPELYRLMSTEDFTERLAAVREGRPPVYAGR